MKANFVWDLPDLKSSESALRALGYVINDWQLSGHLDGVDRRHRTRSGFSYQSGGGSVNLTGSPDYGARIRIVGDTGGGCSSDHLPAVQHGRVPGAARRTASASSPARATCTGVSRSALDLSIARNIRLRGGRNIQIRADLFNAPNAAGITGRNTTLTMSSPSDPVTNVAPVFDPVTGC